LTIRKPTGFDPGAVRDILDASVSAEMLDEYV
jgi:hypothetical protein